MVGEQLGDFIRKVGAGALGAATFGIYLMEDQNKRFLINEQKHEAEARAIKAELELATEKQKADLEAWQRKIEEKALETRRWW